MVIFSQIDLTSNHPVDVAQRKCGRKALRPQSRFCLALALGVVFLFSTNSFAQEAKLRLPEMPLHDPFIVADSASHTYYLYTSNVSRLTGVKRVGTMVYKSKDLLDWEKN